MKRPARRTAHARHLAVLVGAATTFALLGGPLPSQAAPSGASTTAFMPMLAQPVPGHTGLVPSKPRTNTPRIPNGEIWDIEVVGTRVFIAGTFTSLQNTHRRRHDRQPAQPRVVQHQHRPDRHDLPARPSTAASRPSRRRPTAPSSSSPARSTPSTASPSARSPASTSTTGAPVAGFTGQRQQPGHRARRHQHNGLRRRPVHATINGQDTSRAGRGQRHHRRGRPRLRQPTSPAASGSTARSLCSS